MGLGCSDRCRRAFSLFVAEKLRQRFFLGTTRALVGVSVREKDEVAVIVRYEKNIRRTCGSVRSSLSVLARLATVGSEATETTFPHRRDEETSVRRSLRLPASTRSGGQAE